MPKPIVVVQTSENTRAIYRKEFSEAGLSPESYLLTESPEEAEREVCSEEYQLLVIGTIQGDEERAKELVRRAKTRNSKLVAVNFSSSRQYGEPYDATISKVFDRGKLCGHLILYMRGYLHSRLVEWPGI